MKSLVCRKWFFGGLVLLIVALCMKVVAENNASRAAELGARSAENREEGKLAVTSEYVYQKTIVLERRADLFRPVSFWLWVASGVVVLFSIFRREPVNSSVIVVLVVISGLFQFLIV